MIDIKKLFEDHEIEYSTTGKNATRGWIQVHCPFKDCSDSSNHMGVDLKKATYHCWICDRRGPVHILFALINGLSFRVAEEIVRRYDDEILEEPPETIIGVEKVVVKGFSVMGEQHKKYLRGRNYDPDFLARKYLLGGFSTWGRFPYRIGIPVYEHHKLVNMTARDITGLQPQRYLSLRNDEAVVPIKECVYNYDALQENGNILVVEGPSDVWRIGGSCCSTLGTAVTYSQLLAILSKNPRSLFVLFDNSTIAKQHAENLCYMAKPFINHVEVLSLDRQLGVKDPGELTPDQGLSIKTELKL